MIVERTWKERTKEKLKVVGLSLFILPVLYMVGFSHNIILSMIGVVITIVLPFALIPIGLFVLNVDTSYYKTVEKERQP